MKINSIVFIYPVLLLLYSVYSYAYTDPNLILSSHPLFLSFQYFMWNLSQSHRFWSTFIFLSLVMCLFGMYLYIVQLVRKKRLNGNNIMWLLISSVAALFISYPALSHDVFNYLFNAKMVLLYQANPHVQVALNFPQDDWLRFMHNTHTPAPYGYGFTALSLLPFWLGAGHLKLTIMLFRMMMIVSYGGVLVLQWLLNSQSKKRMVELVAFGLNPLILIEIISNIHNDLTMMAFALLSLFFAQIAVTKRIRWIFIPAALMLALSISIKYVTVLLLVGSGIFIVRRRLHTKLSFGGMLTIAHLLPLVSNRSQRYLPWYLSWAMTFLPFTQEKWLKRFVIAASAAALLSYIPFLYRGEYTQEVQLMRTLIAFLPPLSLLFTERLLARSKN